MPTNAAVVYRLASISDADALVGLRAAFLAEISGVDPTDRSLLEKMRDYFTSTLPTGQYIGYVAEISNELIATAGLVYHDHPPSTKNPTGREGYIMNMYTRPDWRGQGIATTLLQRLIETAAANRCHHVGLHILPKSLSLYQRAGFTKIETEMRLPLSSKPKD